ncbi:MAG: DedA family protein [Solirubrobacterales bacterium]|nr:DedA family protein [Solirubrobacterales bacterium]
MLAALVNVANIGYPLLFLLVMAESAGVPVPGETALITGAVLASQGHLDIVAVIALAAAAAIVGDNIGYLIGRKAGRWLLERPGAFEAQRREVLLVGEPFFQRHGPKAVFFGRFILGLRTWASWLAGTTRMRWRSFAVWNAAGGICWATGVGMLAYSVGHSASSVLQLFAIIGLVAFALAVGGFVALRRLRRRAPRQGGAHGSGRKPPPARAE